MKFVLLTILAALSVTPYAQTPAEDIRVNLTRVLIEKARTWGREHPAPPETPARDGYKALKHLLVAADKDESESDPSSRPYRLLNFIQGVCELERAEWMKDRTISIDITMGKKVEGLENTVIVKFWQYRRGDLSRPLKNITWHLSFREQPGNGGKTYKLYDANLI